MTSVRVLHVVESFGGGVASAVHQYAAATPEVEHHLLRAMRPDFVDDGEGRLFRSIHQLSRSPIRAVVDLRAAVREVVPDVIHAHSSLAGLVVRTGARNRRKARILYTPHGYSFERQDVGPLLRTSFRTAEWILSWNTDLVVACAQRERRLAAFGGRRDAIWVPNVAPSDVSKSGPAPLCTASAGIVGVGRLSAAKDPGFFASVAEEVHDSSRDVPARWVGDGDGHHRERLLDAGVSVTGWRPRREALNHVRASGVYVHSSAWDAAPLSLLEAISMGVPSIARRVPSLADLPAEVSAESPAEVAHKARDLLQASDVRDRNLQIWRTHFRENTLEVQRERLFYVYGLALRGTQ